MFSEVVSFVWWAALAATLGSLRRKREGDALVASANKTRMDA
jgi:hypothetical protein